MLHSFTNHHRTWLLTGLTGAILVGGAFALAGTAAADYHQSSPPPAGIPNTSLTEAVDAALEGRPDCDATAALLDDSAETVWSVILECDDGAMHYVEVDAVTGDIKGKDEPNHSASGDTASDTAGNDKSSGNGDGQTADKKSGDKDDKAQDPNDASGTGANADKSDGDTKDKKKSDKDSDGDVAAARD